MTIPTIPDDLKAWLKAAPLPVVLLICLATTGAMGSWVWAVAAEVDEQKAKVAVAAAEGRAAVRAAQNVENRLARVEDKLDRLMEIVAGLAARRADDGATAERRIRDREQDRRAADKEKNR